MKPSDLSDLPDQSLQTSSNQLDRKQVGKESVMEGEKPSQQQEFSLPPTDGGIQAWLFLAGCFVVEAIVWGLPFSFGLFQDFYSTHEPFKSDASGIAAIGTSALGVLYLGCPFCLAAVQYWPLVRRWSVAVGVTLLVISLLASSFATDVSQLIVAQGVTYGIGGAVLYSPVVTFVDEWFIQRKGLAYGVMWAGTGFSGVVMPFITSWLLQHHSFRTTLRVWAVIFVVLALPLLKVVKPRIPESQKRQTFYIDLSFIKERSFMILQLGNILQGLGFFIPTVYLPSYARSIGAKNAAATATVSLLNGALATSLTDSMSRPQSSSARSGQQSLPSCFGGSLCLPCPFVFSTIYGFFAGAFSSTYSGVAKEIRKVNPEADAGMVIGMLVGGRAIGSVICGPLSEILMRNQGWVGRAELGYGTVYVDRAEPILKKLQNIATLVLSIIVKEQTNKLIDTIMQIAIVGVGALGHHILNAILATGKHSVTILTRGEPRLDDPRIKWRKVNYSDRASLTEALRGIETCISTAASFDDKSFVGGQIALAEACIAAGVRRFVPSEFELDPHTRKDRIPYLAAKRQVLSYLNTPEVRNKIQCTIFTPGIFYDYYSPMVEDDGKRHASSESLVPIGFDMVVDLKSCRAELVDGMDDARIRFTAVDDVGKFVAKALELDNWPDQFLMSGENLNCMELIQLCERVRGKPFEIERISIAEMEKKMDEAKRANDMMGMFKWITPPCILEGEFWWDDKSAPGVADIRNIFPEEKFVSLEEFLRKWW
ncbi:hypothetical protein ACJ72_00960 [Emergomyces africanus]|uniref:NmrA-like domain-containing protein n=1 Tax=Emergomyces africanus TaxID=1955775 RepID=A0A1B7P6P5_9EURO|nr:hypothetical protein ACJ72_00960 [Emergomyces africanus]